MAVGSQGRARPDAPQASMGRARPDAPQASVGRARPDALTPVRPFRRLLHGIRTRPPTAQQHQTMHLFFYPKQLQFS